MPAVIQQPETSVHHGAYSYLCQFYKALKLHTDACRSGLGAILYQTHDNRTNAIIAYTSRSLTKAETHYPTHKQEFLTLKWPMIEKFHEYLYRSTFNVYTNNNPLMYFLMMESWMP